MVLYFIAFSKMNIQELIYFYGAKIAQKPTGAIIVINNSINRNIYEENLLVIVWSYLPG